MNRRSRTSWLEVVGLCAVVAALIGPALPVAADGRATVDAALPGRSADLAAGLGADGTFRGGRGLAGTVDSGRWTLVSDPASGEPPRFAEADTVSPAVAGPWSGLGSNGAGNGALNNIVYAVAFSGSDLYVGGTFTNAAGKARADYVARWNGSAWSALGSNGAGNGALNGTVDTLVVSGGNLYAGGSFTDAAGKAKADYIARWNGSTWSSLGSNGAGNGALNGTVHTLAAAGGALYAGGSFTNASNIATADHVAKWAGSAWTALGSNGSGEGALNDTVYALAISGTNLYAGGAFLGVGPGFAGNRVAKWNGSAWSSLGPTGGALNSSVLALAVAGSNVYVGGDFTDAAGIATADYVARWNGTAWSALGSNVAGDGALDSDVFALAIYGSNLLVGGDFTNGADVAEIDYVAKWNGSAWLALGSNGSGDGALPDYVEAVAVSGRNLDVGGAFLDADGIATADFVAHWHLGGAFIRKPDGRIRLGTGMLVGNNVYDTDGAGQQRTGSAARGSSITFGISIQNDGTGVDRFKVRGTGAATNAYAVKYFRGTTDVTAAVLAGTYRTPSLAPGATYLITARVSVKSTAAVGSSVTRLVTLSSVASAADKDAVKFIGKRA